MIVSCLAIACHDYLGSRRHSNWKASEVVKFSLSSGHHWIFGVVDNAKGTAHVTDILDNSDFRSTHIVIGLLVLWVGVKLGSAGELEDKIREVIR